MRCVPPAHRSTPEVPILVFPCPMTPLIVPPSCAWILPNLRATQELSPDTTHWLFPGPLLITLQGAGVSAPPWALPPLVWECLVLCWCWVATVFCVLCERQEGGLSLGPSAPAIWKPCPEIGVREKGWNKMIDEKVGCEECVLRSHTEYRSLDKGPPNVCGSWEDTKICLR
jgi:hypothetical protein